MIVFGGILDVTKELDDMMIYDLDNNRWGQLFEELMLSHIKQKYGNLIMPQDREDDHYSLSEEVVPV